MHGQCDVHTIICIYGASGSNFDGQPTSRYVRRPLKTPQSAHLNNVNRTKNREQDPVRNQNVNDDFVAQGRKSLPYKVPGALCVSQIDKSSSRGVDKEEQECVSCPRV